MLLQIPFRAPFEFAMTKGKVIGHKYYFSVRAQGLKNMSHIMRKPVYAICEQQRCRSACASA